MTKFHEHKQVKFLRCIDCFDREKIVPINANFCPWCGMSKKQAVERHISEGFCYLGNIWGIWLKQKNFFYNDHDHLAKIITKFEAYFNASQREKMHVSNKFWGWSEGIIDCSLKDLFRIIRKKLDHDLSKISDP